jgi:hypothetical protein
VSAGAAVAQPATLLEKTSRIEDSHNTPSPVRIRVKVGHPEPVRGIGAELSVLGAAAILLPSALLRS